MYKNMEEVKLKFDLIKDHKPRATKKLNELGDILSSAYVINPVIANEMWQYIIDLNISDDISFSKFYIAQVFNKLTTKMKPKDATEFLAMNPTRVRLMIIHGYSGGTLWHCLDILLNVYIASESVDNALILLEYFYEKFGGLNSGNSEIINVVKNTTRICAECITTGQHQETANAILNEVGSSSNVEVNTYVDIVKAIYNIAGEFDFDVLFEAAIEEKYPMEFFDLLWVAKEKYSETELRNKWIEYLDNCEGNEVRPYNYIRESGLEYGESKLKFYVDLECSADELLDYYFCRSNIYEVEKGVIWIWIELREWDLFTKYIAQTIMNTSESSFEHSHIHVVLKSYMDSCFLEEWCDSTDNYGRSYKKLMKTRAKEFGDTLAKISAISVGSEVHESYHEFIKAFLQKLNGNLDSVLELGFDDEVDLRKAEDRLKEYIHDFLESGKLIHEGWGTKYKLIKNALCEEVTGNCEGNQITYKIDITKMLAKSLGIEGDEEEKDIDESLERDYRLALDDEVAEFYFKHYPLEYNERASLLSACVRKNDINRAIELIDLMIETEKNEEYDELNGWGRQNMLTFYYLIDEYDYGKKEEWRGQNFTDDMRQIVKQLVHRMMPHLPDKAQQELKKQLYKVDPENDDNNEYIEELLEDVDVYTTFPKPRGKGGAPNINRMSAEITSSFERLSSMNRLDVIVEIMTKFASVRDILKPVSFDTWMRTMSSALKDGDMIKVFRDNRFIFEAWLDGDNLREWDIKCVAENLATSCTREEFIEFRNLVISKKGKIAGLDSCFKATSENTPKQIIVDGQTVQVKLDYVEVMGDSPVLCTEIHLISEAKTRKLDSVRLIKCEINGMETKDCRFISEMDEEPTIGYKIFDVNKETSDELTIYSDFFEQNGIDEINQIILKLVVMDNDVEVIEELSEVIIILDDASGEYKVTAEAKSVKCNINTSNEEDINSDVKKLPSNVLQTELNPKKNVNQIEMEMEMDSIGFEDMVIYDGDVLVEFCGINFLKDPETLILKIRCDNHTDAMKQLWLKNLLVNRESHSFIQLLGYVEANDSGYCNYILEGVVYDEIESIEFIIEVDDLDYNTLAISKNVKLNVNIANETFNVSVK